MRTPPNECAPELASEPADAPERRCILTGERGPRGTLNRLALDDASLVWPDVRARAPGRGAWLGVDRAALEIAVAKGKLKGALARAFKSSDVSVPADFAERLGAALRDNALNRLGLEARAGALLLGSDRISESARAGKIAMLLHAADAGQDGSRKLDQAWRVGSDAEGSDLRGITLPVGREPLSQALGRENAVHIGVADDRAAKRIGEALDKWLAYEGLNSASTACENTDEGSSARERARQTEGLIG